VRFVLLESVIFSKPDSYSGTHQIHDYSRPEGTSMHANYIKSGNRLPDTLLEALEHHHSAGVVENKLPD
jgi:hypothetical protein